MLLEERDHARVAQRLDAELVRVLVLRGVEVDEQELDRALGFSERVRVRAREKRRRRLRARVVVVVADVLVVEVRDERGRGDDRVVDLAADRDRW